MRMICLMIMMILLIQPFLGYFVNELRIFQEMQSVTDVRFLSSGIFRHWLHSEQSGTMFWVEIPGLHEGTVIWAVYPREDGSLYRRSVTINRSGKMLIPIFPVLVSDPRYDTEPKKD